MLPLFYDTTSGRKSQRKKNLQIDSSYLLTYCLSFFKGIISSCTRFLRRLTLYLFDFDFLVFLLCRFFLR